MSEGGAETRLALEGVSAGYHGRRGPAVLQDVTLRVARGEAVGLVGESGSGKSTIAKVITGQLPLIAGRVLIGDQEAATLGRRDRQQVYRSLQLVPQDPYASLNPRRTVGFSIAEALAPTRPNVGRDSARIAHWLEQVRLPPEAMHRYPHEFSGGQRQRIAIARALAVEPDLLIADEITSALDVSVQAEILALLEGLRRELSLTMLFISHNLAVVRQVCERVVVFHRGRVVEQGPSARIFAAPEHPYTRNLIASVPGSAGFAARLAAPG